MKRIEMRDELWRLHFLRLGISASDLRTHGAELVEQGIAYSMGFMA